MAAPDRISNLAGLIAVVLIAGACIVVIQRAARMSGGDDSMAAELSPGAEARADASATQPWTPPRAKSADEYVEQRHLMVQTQIAAPSDFRTPVRDRATLEAMRQVPRHAFVPDNVVGDAYRDTPLPIGHGQTISQPYIVALMTEALGIGPQSKVLEIGTGSGYQAAVLAHLTPHVYTIEIIEPLAERARRVLREQGYDYVQVRHGDGYFGWKEAAPFDAIIVTCAAGHLPTPLWEQLAPGGRIVVPMGSQYEVQRLIVITKTADGRRQSRTITDVRFVPMTGEILKR